MGSLIITFINIDISKLLQGDQMCTNSCVVTQHKQNYGCVATQFRTHPVNLRKGLKLDLKGIV